jgi:hypothetical protein
MAYESRDGAAPVVGWFVFIVVIALVISLGYCGVMVLISKITLL